jgi:hypothetical protein
VLQYYHRSAGQRAKPDNRKRGKDALGTLLNDDIVVDRKLKVAQQTHKEDLDLGNRETIADARPVPSSAATVPV